jgi:hypothetical protein
MSDDLLRAIYEGIYKHFCEVAAWRWDQLPSLDQVTIVWNARLRETLGRCFVTSLRIVEINTIYHNPRLRHELFWHVCQRPISFATGSCRRSNDS